MAGGKNKTSSIEHTKDVPKKPDLMGNIFFIISSG
jgi:hypothetical protein